MWREQGIVSSHTPGLVRCCMFLVLVNISPGISILLHQTPINMGPCAAGKMLRGLVVPICSMLSIRLSLKAFRIAACRIQRVDFAHCAAPSDHLGHGNLRRRSAVIGVISAECCAELKASITASYPRGSLSNWEQPVGIWRCKTGPPGSLEPSVLRRRGSDGELRCCLRPCTTASPRAA